MDNIKTTPIPTIQKELIDGIHFPKQEVLKNPEHIKQRRDQAKKAMMLGNGPTNNKVKIVFEDGECKKQVETTVWGVTDRYILLKSGMSLPIHRVHEIIT